MSYSLRTHARTYVHTHKVEKRIQKTPKQKSQKQHFFSKEEMDDRKSLQRDCFIILL